uniref:AlNc14C39G3389 protein n=1 Tax=Albugo laibachii Nc14 TaxID=890382 RepID=F0W9C6_9STRA|nr:AlNc14C39G3389 [Albugo laibachii Nc14]CCA18384.1 AlNc14C49G3914 [Albugo laibachii Nc14]|eukprot:CCA18384.1 AlNc14C49G3914 [Albugo laibachii Nc14]
MSERFRDFLVSKPPASNRSKNNTNELLESLKDIPCFYGKIVCGRTYNFNNRGVMIKERK